MKRIHFGSTSLWTTLLLVSVMFASFVLPVLPVAWQRNLFLAVYTIIFFTAIFSLERRNNYLLILLISTLLLAWFSRIFNMPVLHIISKAVNILFFMAIVFSLIRQIATARRVTARVILDSIVGYLLLGVIYSIFIAFIIQQDPGAFSVHQTEVSQPGDNINISVPLYFSYVTLATLGYGDILPLKPYSRSLATMITISGQFYIAIIVALLVGKFSASRATKNEADET